MEYRFEIQFGGKHKNRESEIIEVAEFIGVKSYKAKGKRLTSFMVDNIQEIEPVVRKESEIKSDDSDEEKGDAEDKNSHNSARNPDPAQMKLEL